MSLNRNHKHKHKTRSKRVRGVEGKLDLVFSTLGLLLLVFGLYNYLTVGGIFERLEHFLHGGSRASESLFVSSGTNMSIIETLLVGFLPALILLLFSFYYSKKPVFKFVNTISLYYLVFFQFYFFFSRYLNYQSSYTNYTIASFVLVVPVLFYFISYWVFQRKIILYLMLVYFYGFIFELLIVKFYYGYTLGMVLLFSLLLFLITLRTRYSLIQFINFFIAYFFLFAFVYRKLYVNRDASYLTLYFVLSLLYLLLFFLISFILHLKSTAVRSVLFNWLSTAFYLIFTFYTLSFFNQLFYFSYFLLLGLGLYCLSFLVVKKYVLSVNPFLLQFGILFLFSAYLASYIGVGWLLVFLAVFSLLTVLYAQYLQDKLLMYAAALSAILLVFCFIYFLVILYTPLFVFHDTEFLSKGLLIVSSVTVALFFVKKTFNNLSFSLTNSWFDRKKYVYFITVFFFVSFYLFLQCLVSFFSLPFKTSIYLYEELFLLAGYFFLLGVLKYKTFFQLKKSYILYYVLGIYLQVTIFRFFFKFPYVLTGFNFTLDFVVFASLIHYILLFCIVGSYLLLFKFNSYSDKALFGKRSRSTVFVFLLITVLIREYDFIMLLWSYGSSELTDLVLEQTLIDHQHLPYSMLILSGSLLSLYLGIIQANRFLRGLSISLIILVLLKFFMYDFSYLNENNRTVILIVFGVVLLVISKLYARFKSKGRGVKKVRLEDTSSS